MSAADLPEKRPGDFRLTYYRGRGLVRPGMSSGRVITIGAAESYLEVRGSPGGPPTARKPFTMTAAEMDAFYAAMRATGVVHATTRIRSHPIPDYPPSSLRFEWDGQKVEISISYRETVSDPRAFERAIAVIDRLVAQKGL